MSFGAPATGRRVLVAPDKFRGTATAIEAARAMAEGARDAGWLVTELPLADGGEGTLEALGGGNRRSVVAGPMDRPVEADWRLEEGAAVIEMAAASGLVAAGGRAKNDPLAATTRGTGELVAEAIRAGASRIVLGVGGSATTDGGLDAVEALRPLMPLDGSRGYLVEIACDVTTRFVDAARLFGPQKGASPRQVRELEDRLTRLVVEYRDKFGLDVSELPGTGAAGGLAGGLAAIGATIRPGFDLVASQLGLDRALVAADLVMTGEGALDAQSLQGKVVGGVSVRAQASGIPCVSVVGRSTLQRPSFDVVSLVTEFGEAAAMTRTLECLRLAVRGHLASLSV